MKNTTGRVPSLKNSQTVNQGELQNAKQKMNTSMNMGQSFSTGMTSGMVPSLSNSTSIGQNEKQKVKQKMQNSNSSNSNRFY
ncbi:hypothetical protein [Proteiniborus sp.]|uniref:hypothetical protein n=1 Tax=Proteiniborus sp. TaxID=2079015 RepID=UPI00332C6A52